MGLSEFDFWNMTLGEIERFAKSYKRREEKRLKEKAFLYYRLADLIGISNGRYYTKHFSYPEIYEVFGGIFEEEEIETKKQEERDRKSIELIRHFYEQNKKIKE